MRGHLSAGGIFLGKQERRFLLREQEEAECSDNLFLGSVIGHSEHASLLWPRGLKPSV